jgi:adenylate kinase family enzyme
MSPTVAGVTTGAVPLPFASAEEHLLAELEWLKLVLQQQVLRMRAAGLLVENDFRGLYVPDEHVDAVLRRYPEQTNGHKTQIQQELDRIEAQINASAPAGITLPLVRLSGLLNLDLFERRVLVACAASEVDLSFEALYAYVQNDVNRKRPTADLLLKIFLGSASERLARRSALSGESKLVKCGLIRIVEAQTPDNQSFLGRGFRTDDRITDFLLGHSSIDLRLCSFAHITNGGMPLRNLFLPTELKGALSNVQNQGAVAVLCGPDGSGKRSIAEALSKSLGRPLIVADMGRALASPVPLTELLSLLNREAFLQGANLFLGNCQALLAEKGQPAQHIAALEQGLSPLGNLVFVAAEASPAEFRIRTSHPNLCFQISIPSFEHRQVLWEKAIQETGLDSIGPDTKALGSKFALTGGQIHAACRSAASSVSLQSGSGASLSLAALEAAAREQSGHGLRRLAQKVESKQSWADLILPARAMQQLRAVSASHKYRDLVYSQWGFGNKLAMGKGLNVLFFGPSGTGKTMAAGILAKELGLDIYKIDLSSVVSKYIGETEKQLSQIFREAQTSNAILLFDEADALFGKRSEVKDAHDRYANVETAYLLQNMEEYEGIVVLTTNFRKNIDDAFARRMHHMVEFSFPDAAHRLRIWKGLIPAGAQLADGVDFGFLARQFELAGGNIRNVVLAGAFLAAEDGGAIRMDHLILATAREMQKLGKLPSRSEFREYFDIIHGQDK